MQKHGIKLRFLILFFSIKIWVCQTAYKIPCLLKQEYNCFFFKHSLKIPHRKMDEWVFGSFLVQKGKPNSWPCYYLHRFTGSPCRSSPNMPVLQLSGHNIPILSPIAMHTGASSGSRLFHSTSTRSRGTLVIHALVKRSCLTSWPLRVRGGPIYLTEGQTERRIMYYVVCFTKIEK